MTDTPTPNAQAQMRHLAMAICAGFCGHRLAYSDGKADIFDPIEVGPYSSDPGIKLTELPSYDATRAAYYAAKHTWQAFLDRIPQDARNQRSAHTNRISGDFE